MGYEVLARKWRPKQFADVIGQEHVTTTLRHAIESGRVAHAYLFVGPRGIGKTTLSRLFAKALNCAEGPTADPCDNCDLCREIMAGNSLDVIEIDGASNNGVENIRDLRDTVQFAPSRGRFKIYIIDEVHMLSTGAFNALLKTLEEPPPHVKFIFATTEVDKLPATVISRCQRFDLRRIATALIVETLGKISTSEGVEAEEDALLAIARGAEGGMRDALSALDQIISFKGNKITEADVLSVFGLVSRENLERLTTALLKGDMAASLQIVDDLDRGGKDLRRLVMELLTHIRNLLVFLQLGGESKALDVTREQLAALSEQAKLTDSERVLRIAEQLAELEGRIRYALSRRILLETALVRCCRAATVASIDQLIKLLTAGEELPSLAEVQALRRAPAVAAEGVTSAPAVAAAGATPTAAVAAAGATPTAAVTAAGSTPTAAVTAAGSTPTAAVADKKMAAAVEGSAAPKKVVTAAPRKESRPQKVERSTISPSEVMNDKNVQAAIKIFDGRVIRVEEPR